MQDTSRRILKKIGIAFLCVIGAVVALIVGALLYIGTPYFSARVGTWLTNSSGRNVMLEGKIETHLWSSEPRIVMTDVRVGNAEWGSEPAMFKADRIEFSLRPFELLRGRLVLPELTLDAPEILLEKNAKGDANWKLTQNAQAPVVSQHVPESRTEVPIIRYLKINNGKLTYRDPANHISTMLKVASISGKGADDKISLSGEGKFKDMPFTLDFGGASIIELRDDNKPYPFQLDITVGKTSAHLDGSVEDPVKMTAVDVAFALKGANAADLFPITGIALLPTPPYDVQGRLVRNGKDWKFNDFKGKLGTSDLKGNVTWHPETKPPFFEGDFVSDNLDMRDLAGFIGGHKQPDDPNRVIPDTNLDMSRMQAMNAEVSFHGRHMRMPQMLDDFYMKIILKEGTLSVKPVSFAIAKGKIEADITVDGRKDPPPASVEVTFSHLSLSSLFKPLSQKFGKENVSAGSLAGMATLKGRGKSLHAILAGSDGDIGFVVEGGQLSHLLLNLMGLDIFRSAGLLVTGDESVPMRCVVGDFSVDNGLMTAHPFLIDTSVTTIRGKGTANLKDESMDLRLYVYPKEVTLFSARAPLDVTGTFKKPSVGVDKGALALRGGAAVALGLVAPPAALLAFIGPGLGTHSDCTEVMQKLQEDTGAKPSKH